MDSGPSFTHSKQKMQDPRDLDLYWKLRKTNPSAVARWYWENDRVFRDILVEQSTQNPKLIGFHVEFLSPVKVELDLTTVIIPIESRAQLEYSLNLALIPDIADFTRTVLMTGARAGDSLHEGVMPGVVCFCHDGKPDGDYNSNAWFPSRPNLSSGADRPKKFPSSVLSLDCSPQPIDSMKRPQKTLEPEDSFTNPKDALKQDDFFSWLSEFRKGSDFVNRVLLERERNVEAGVDPKEIDSRRAEFVRKLTLDHQYRRPKTHYDFHFLARVASGIFGLAIDPRFPLCTSTEGGVFREMMFLAILEPFLLHGFKPLWIDGSFLNSLLHTDPPNPLIPSLVVYPQIMIVLPKTNLLQSFFGGIKQSWYCLFIHTHPDTIMYSRLGSRNCINGIITKKEGWKPSHPITSLIANIVNVITYQQGLISEEPSSPKGFGKPTLKQQSKALLLNPTWLGKGYKPMVKRSASPQGGTHASPVTHWRRGHWRNQPVGSKDSSETKPIWIQPVLVNSDRKTS